MEGDLAQGCSRKDLSNKWFIEFEESAFNCSGMRWNDNLTVFPTWRMLDTTEVWHVSEHAERHWRFFLIAARYIYISAVSYRFADVVPGQNKKDGIHHVAWSSWQPHTGIQMLQNSVQRHTTCLHLVAWIFDGPGCDARLLVAKTPRWYQHETLRGERR